ncbi:hypothetical protein YTPLAS73_09010 [Nitrosarchaeum sp.]|nr:hypothetical protein YTPLAS73_09010 [Nitrosarchaeum sp.]
MSMDTLSRITKGDMQKAVALGFLVLFGSAIVYFFVVSDVSQISIRGEIDVNQFWTVFVGIVIGVFTWLGFKTGQQQPAKTT